MESFLEEDIETRVVKGLFRRAAYEAEDEPEDDLMILTDPEEFVLLKDIDWKYAAELCKKMNTRQSCYGSILQNRKLVRFYKGHAAPTGLGAMLFCNQRFEYQHRRSAFIRVASYDGTDIGFGKDNNLIQRETFKGHLPEITRQAADWIEQQLKGYAARRKGIPFLDRPEFPEAAWKELMLNAVIHCDFLNYTDPISVLLFDDSIVITNRVALETESGKFVEEKIVNDAASRLFGMQRQTDHLVPFHGLHRVFALMEEASLPAPEFHLSSIRFTVTIRNRLLPKEEL